MGIAMAVSCLIVGAIILFKMSERLTHIYLLPKDYSGWVEVIYEQPGYPALQQKDNKIVYEVPPSGSIKTSSKNVSGSMVLFYVEINGQKIELAKNVPMIHGLGTSSGGDTNADGIVEKIPERLRFFVGTEEQWRQQPKG